MNEFLNSLKSDLLDRRLLPVLGALALVLIAAIAYVALGSGSSTPTPSAAVSAPVVKAPGVAVSQVKTADVTAGAETTSGSAQQTSGSSRNPFAATPAGKRAQAAAKAKATPVSESGSSSSGASAESGAGSTSTGGATSSPSEEKTPSAPTKPKAKQTVYHVSVLFGTALAGQTPAAAGLTPFGDLKRQQPLPSDAQALVVFRGVVAGGKSATFTLVGEAILRGSAKCLPSPEQCQAIDLQAGQSEELEYAPPGATPVNYILQVVSITSSKAKASSARRAFSGESKSGLKLLRSAGLVSLPGLRYSAAKGVLVFAGSNASAARTNAFAARVRASAWGAPFKG